LLQQNAGHLADLGSGGGFPGMIAAILAADERPQLRVTLVESDKRKAAFLSSVARETQVKVLIVTERIEQLARLEANILTARALAPLDQLLSYADRHLQPGGVALFPKGAGSDDEINQALEHWKFSLQKLESKTNPSAVILSIGGIERV
jgi:16S rRNA (guanine527-N7)-methyltransferase